MLLAGTPVPDAAIRGDPFDAVPLRWNVDARTAVSTDAVDGSNIVALVPGSDPRLRDEYVLYTAHYDHLGVGLPENGDSIYNGFSDNAAGVAMLLSIAERIRRDPPARSIAFAFFTGEERGLLGSSFFAAFPTLPLERVRAVINLDGGAPPVPPVSWRIAGGKGSELGLLAAAVAERYGWTANLTGSRANSDHWPFLARGVPAIFVIPGNEWENTTAAERDALRERFDRYHRPDDEWREDFPFAGLGRYATYALEIGLEVANRR
jgi:Zn-dependent M28 family amino/carboxypeptidase